MTIDGVLDDASQVWVVACAVVATVAIWAVVRLLVARRAERTDRHREMVERAGLFSWEIDSISAEILSIAGNVEAVLGYPADELVGRHVGSVINLHRARNVIKSERRLPNASERHAVVTATHRNGHEVTLREVRLTPRKAGVVRGVSIDITELAQATEALRHQAEHDALTGLANRVRLEHVIDADPTGDERDRLALLLVDLDRFKAINDTLGHPTGDRVLQILANRFEASLGDFELTARMGGDEFAFVVAVGPDTESDARVAGRRVHDLITEPLAVDGLQLSVGASIGVVLAPDHGTSYEDLLKKADIAAYQAKGDGGGVVLYESDPDEIDALCPILVAEVGDALDRSEFELRFLPRIDLDAGHVVGVAGVPLWHHPRFGLLGQREFAEAVNVSAHRQRFAHEMVRQAVAVIAATEAAGRAVPVSVGVSALSVVDQRLPQQVADLLEQHRIPNGLLTVDVPDTGLFDDPRHQRTVAELQATGVRLAISGFGAGPSDVFGLPRLGVGQLCLDASVVRRLDEVCTAIGARSVVEVADRLGIEVVADGVWHDDDVQRLRAVGCRLAQGVAWAPPVYADDVHALINARAGMASD
ncbi:MAG: diguanylate cyclase [Actinomycetota bacterium]